MAALEIIKFDRARPEPDIVDRVAEHILLGGVAILPTDTVYGLIGDATADPAAEMMYTLKERDAQNPLPVFVDTAEGLYRWYIRFNPDYQKLTDEFWPGPLTLVLPVWPGFYLRVGGDGRSVGVRATGEPVVFSLMRKTNRYLLATSANPSGVAAENTDIKAWLDKFPGVRVIWLQPGDFTPQPVSSVIDLTGDMPVLLREGAIDEKTLKKVVPDLTVRR